MLSFFDNNRITFNTEKKIICFFAVYVFILMFFCAGSSPFIDYMSTDSSVFFAIGRSMADGKVAFADVFDHKGWYLYLINYIGALISSSTTIGIFLVEYVFFFINANLLYRIATVWFHNIFKRVVFVVLMLALFLNFFTYSGGNLTESYTITFQLLSIWLILCYSCTKELDHPPVFMFIHGICVGIVFGLRANMIMMWGAIAIVIVFRLLFHKRYKNALLNIAFGIFGLLVAAIPPAIYGIITGSINEMIYNSIIFNLEYSDTPFISGIVQTFGSLFGIGFVSCGVLASIIVCLSRCDIWEKVMFVFMLILSYVCIAISGRGYSHYFAYLLPLLIPIVAKLLSLLNDKLFSISSLRKMIVVCIIFVFAVCCNLRTPIRLLFKPESFYYMQVVNEISDLYAQLPDENNDKVIVTNNNAIVYNKMNVIPDVKYFYLPAISYEKFPDAVNCQVNSILSGENDVVVLFYDNYNEKIIFKQIHNNKEILTYLERNYDLAYEKQSQSVQMWIKKQ